MTTPSIESDAVLSLETAKRMARAVLRDEHAPREGGSGDAGFPQRALNQPVVIEVCVTGSMPDSYGRWLAKWRKWDGPSWKDMSDGQVCYAIPPVYETPGAGSAFGMGPRPAQLQKDMCYIARLVGPAHDNSGIGVYECAVTRQHQDLLVYSDWNASTPYGWQAKKRIWDQGFWQTDESTIVRLEDPHGRPFEFNVGFGGGRVVANAMYLGTNILGEECYSGIGVAFSGSGGLLRGDMHGQHLGQGLKSCNGLMLNGFAELAIPGSPLYGNLGNYESVTLFGNIESLSGSGAFTAPVFFALDAFDGGASIYSHDLSDTMFGSVTVRGKYPAGPVLDGGSISPEIYIADRYTVTSIHQAPTPNETFTAGRLGVDINANGYGLVGDTQGAPGARLSHWASATGGMAIGVEAEFAVQGISAAKKFRHIVYQSPFGYQFEDGVSGTGGGGDLFAGGICIKLGEGSSLADGDYGDIEVSGGGTVMTVESVHGGTW